MQTSVENKKSPHTNAQTLTTGRERAPERAQWALLWWAGHPWKNIDQEMTPSISTKVENLGR